MESIAKFPRALFAALFVLAGAFAFAAQPATAAMEAQKGCWYQTGDEPACDWCGDSCGSGQQCCTISVQ